VNAVPTHAAVDAVRSVRPSACVDVLTVGRDAAAAAAAVERHYRHIIYLLGKKKNTMSERNR